MCFWLSPPAPLAPCYEGGLFDPPSTYKGRSARRTPLPLATPLAAPGRRAPSSIRHPAAAPLLPHTPSSHT
jgi:hypothetical protein